MTPFTEDQADQGLRAAWSLFIAIENGDDEFADEVLREFGETIHAGWPILAGILRKALIEHANDCDCGSDAWLERQRLKSLEDLP
jgi:ketosteroid isomerase-like protein